MSLQTAIPKAYSTISGINNLIDDYTLQDRMKDKLMAGLLSLAREHYSAMIELINAKHYGSASALARPLYEAQIRLTWLALCASEEDAIAINKGTKEFKGITESSKKIDKVIGDSAFYNVLKANEDALHDYTHGGMRQVY
jgi:hypothetical protein